MALAEAANVPVTTTLHAMGVFSEHHPLSLHMLGMHGAAYANYAIQESDLIVAIGSRFDDRTTGILSKCDMPVLASDHDPLSAPLAERVQVDSRIRAPQSLAMLRPAVTS